MQNLLGRASWNADRVRDELRAYVTEHLGEAGGILVVDETCFPKLVLALRCSTCLISWAEWEIVLSENCPVRLW
jgi:hypothetical protein